MFKDETSRLNAYDTLRFICVRQGSSHGGSALEFGIWSLNFELVALSISWTRCAAAPDERVGMLFHVALYEL